MAVLVGHPVQDFRAQATSGKDLLLSTLKGYNVVLYFYPKDNTPGCTQESQEFAELYDEFKKAKTLVFGISRDDIKSHENFRQWRCLPFQLISDPEEKLCVLFDVIKLKPLYGKMVRGVERSTFLIDSKGVLRQEWRRVKVDRHAEDVLKAARAL